MADDNMTPDAGDPGETMNMGSGDLPGADEPKKEKKPGDWVTVEMPKVQKPAPASQPPVAPPPQAADVERTVLEGAGSSVGTPPPMAAPVSQPTPGASSGYATTPPVIETAPSASSGGMAWMEGLGIKDPGTQRIVLFGGGGALLLCCLCSCVAVVVTVVLPMMSTAP